MTAQPEDAETRRHGDAEKQTDPLSASPRLPISASPSAPAAIKLRRGQRRIIELAHQYRTLGVVMMRQYGKTTPAAGYSVLRMMKKRGHTVNFGSVQLDLGREIVRKEMEIVDRGIRSAIAAAKADVGRLEVADHKTGKTISQAGAYADDLADIYEANRLEFRFRHGQAESDFSRTLVMALTPATVGRTGDLICDEIGRMRDWRETFEAIRPFIRSNPDFRALMLTTPPPDDTHLSFTQLAPPPGANFQPNKEGNIYESVDYRFPILRLDAFDAWLDGIAMFDDVTGEPLSPEESRKRDPDKEAWDRNYGCKFLVGGSAACDLLRLNVAMERGQGHCEYFAIDDELDLQRALAWLPAHLGQGPIGIGIDIATTEKAVSNPTSVSIVEQDSLDYKVRAILTWKTRDPDLAEDRIVRIERAIESRPAGGRARAASIDATSEKYFAERLRKILRGKLPVNLVVGSERYERSGHETTNWKQYLGSVYVATLDDNHLWLPSSQYVKDDHRLVKKERGQFVCEPAPDGKHGDTFDSTKLALHAVTGRGKAFAQPAPVTHFECATL